MSVSPDRVKARMARLRLEIGSPLSAPAEWDGQALAHPQAAIFHTSAWAKVLCDTYGFSPVYFNAFEANTWVGVLPVMEVNSALTGRRGVSLPFTDACPALLTDGALCHALWEAAIQHGQARGWRYLEGRGGRPPMAAARVSVSFYEHRLDLTRGEDALWTGLDGATRRALRKAGRSGLAVRWSQDLEAVRSFYRLQCETRQKHGLPPQPFSFFEKIQEHLLSRGLGWLVIASADEQPVAASMFLLAGQRAVYKFGASKEAFQHMRPNNYIMWEAIRRFAQWGIQELSLGRTSLANEGLRRFKLGWGAREERLDYYKYNFRKADFVEDADQAIGWHNHVFRRLPRGLSRLLGQILYRHLA